MAYLHCVHVAVISTPSLPWGINVSNPALPSLEYLMTCTDRSLGELELACLNRSQQCLRAAREEMEEAVAQREAAGVARWLIENRPVLIEQARQTIEYQESQGILSFPFPAPVALPCSEGSHSDGRSAYLAKRRCSGQ